MLNLRPLIRYSSNSLDAITGLWISLVLLTNFPLFFDFMNGTVFAPYYYMLTIVFALIYYVKNPIRSMKFVREPLFVWSSLCLVIVLINYIRLSVGSFEQFVVDVEYDNMQRLILFPVVAFICWRMQSSVLWVALSVAALIIATGNVIDLLKPGIMAPYIEGIGSGRADGFYGNANPAAEAALLAVILIRDRCPKIVFMLLYLVAGLAVAATFSRSGMGFWFLAGVYFSFSGRLPRYFLIAPVAVFVGIGVFIDRIEDFLRSFPEYEYRVEAMLSRLTFFSDTFESNEVIGELAQEDRGVLAMLAFKSAMAKPIFGYGYDYIDPITSVRPHNLIITMTHIYGVFGFMLWASLAYLLYKEERRINGIYCLVTAAFISAWLRPGLRFGSTFNNAFFIPLYFFASNRVVYPGTLTFSTVTLSVSLLGIVSTGNGVGLVSVQL